MGIFYIIIFKHDILDTKHFYRAYIVTVTFGIHQGQNLAAIHLLFYFQSAEESSDDMGNSVSSDSVPVRYSPVSGVQIGRRTRPDNHFHKTSGAISKPRQRKQRRGSGRLSSSYEVADSSSSRNGTFQSVNGPFQPVNSGIDIQDIAAERLTHSASDINDSASICGSLKGNLSLKSLYDRNCKYGFDENFQIVSKGLKSHSSEESLRIDISSGQDIPSISSVLLTPPSDEDLLNSHHQQFEISSKLKGINELNENHEADLSQNAIYDNHIENGYLDNSLDASQPLFVNCEKNQSQKQLLHDSGITDQSIGLSHNTDSSDHSSPLHSSNSSKLFSNYTTDVSGNLSLEDDGDTSSPLHRVRLPDKQFRQSLLHRLHEYATVNGSSTSTNSTPDVSPYHRAASVSIDSEDLVNGLCTPEQEIFSSGAKLGETTTECFETLETEVYNIEDEFQDICAKLDELKRLAARNSGSEDVDVDSEYTPSDPLARRACDLVERARDKIIRSRSVSLSEESCGSLSESCRDTDGVELSWDSEHMTEGPSQNKQSSFKEKFNSLAKTLESQDEESDEKFLTASDNSEETSEKVQKSLVPDLCNNFDTAATKRGSRLSDWEMSMDESSESVSVTTCFHCGKIRIKAEDLDLSGFQVDICRCSEKLADDTDLDVDTEHEFWNEEPKQPMKNSEPSQKSSQGNIYAAASNDWGHIVLSRLFVTALFVCNLRNRKR